MYTTNGGKYPIMAYVSKETFEQIEYERKNYSRSSFVANILEDIFTPELRNAPKLNGSDTNVS